MRALARVLGVAAFLLLPATAWAAAPFRILIAVAHSEGQPGEKPLKHTARDVARVRDVLTSLGGVESDAAIAVTNPTPQQLAVAFDRASAMAQAHASSDVAVFFYFSGHGDKANLHLGSALVPLGEIASRLSRIPARLRVVITDACRTTDATRAKGATVEQGFSMSVEEMTMAAGAVWLHASSDGEAAQESDELGGAVFTHYWVTGLSGSADANDDGRVTFAEAFSYAYDQTLYRTVKSSGILQRPSMSLDLRESAPFVVTRTPANTAKIVLPRGVDVSYVVYALGSHAVLLEAWSARDRAQVVAVPKGRYIVQRRAGSGESAHLNGAAEVSLAENERRELKDAEFHAFGEEALALKGGSLHVHPHEVSAFYTLSVGTLPTRGHGPGLHYAYRASEWLVGARAAVTFDQRAADVVVERARRWEVGVFVDRELREWLRVGAGPIVTYLDRRLLRADGDRLVLAGYAPEEVQQTVVAGAEAHAQLRISVGPRFWLGAEARGSALVVPLDGTKQILGYGAFGLHLGADF